eukprot:2598040-Pyramimonas_sp.AAC.1
MGWASAIDMRRPLRSFKRLGLDACVVEEGSGQPFAFRMCTCTIKFMLGALARQLQWDRRRADIVEACFQ